MTDLTDTATDGGLMAGPIRYHADAWAPAYGSPAPPLADGDSPVEAVEERSDIAVVDPYVGPLLLIDGTRRAELVLWATAANGQRAPGLAGAYAAGAVAIRPSIGLRFEGIRVGRVALWGPGGSGTVVGPNRYTWESTPTSAIDPAGLLQELQNRMRAAEGELALDATRAGWPVILDGPLNRIRELNPGVCGYIKSHYRPIPDPELLPGLAVGARTVLYTAGNDRYTCYARIGVPPPGGDPLGGIIRLEFPAIAGLSNIAQRASQYAARLPAFAGRHHRDPRAPANMTPIRNLERRLTRHLGPLDTATRAARTAVARGTIH